MAAKSAGKGGPTGRSAGLTALFADPSEKRPQGSEERPVAPARRRA